ncbi:MAG: glycosyltransferase family 4 protein [Bacteroidales bacterium]|nr:glycosyltransferase family 4 protein [Bacteroidales bacterium]
MKYLIATLFLIAIELVYFALAKRFNIVDRPNERSSHSSPTLLGGGIIFFLAVLYYSVTNNFAYPWLLLGLSLSAIISYIDDLHPLPSIPRMIVQFVTLALIMLQLQAFGLATWKIVLHIVAAVAIVNIYNFMDGINGMLAAYTLVVLGTFIFINLCVSHFIDNGLILIPLIAVGVFSFFNFRTKARCFSGDVGSITLGCLVLFLIGRLIQSTPTNNVGLSYLVFIGVFLADGGLTILKRMLRGENILKPHREHLYETLANDFNVPHLYISACYALLQILINICFFLVRDKNLYAVSVAIFLVIAYSTAFFILNNKARPHTIEG